MTSMKKRDGEVVDTAARRHLDFFRSRDGKARVQESWAEVVWASRA